MDWIFLVFSLGVMAMCIWNAYKIGVSKTMHRVLELLEETLKATSHQTDHDTRVVDGHAFLNLFLKNLEKIK